MNVLGSLTENVKVPSTVVGEAAGLGAGGVGLGPEGLGGFWLEGVGLEGVGLG